MTHIENTAVQSLLNTRRLPARLSVDQAACLLGFADHDIPILVRAKCLKPLGNPAKNAQKYFSSVEIERLAQEKDWLDKATKVISRHWQQANLDRHHGHSAGL